MSALDQFKQEVLARTVLSDLIGARVKLVKAGREFKACCPFHAESTPSFTINDDKGFGHCFGCGAHVDAIDWLTRTAGMTFIDALRELGERLGMALPERSPDAQARAARIEGLRPTLAAAAHLFGLALDAPGGDSAGDAAAVRAHLAARRIDADLIAAFALGWAGADGGLAGHGFTRRDLLAAGLLGQSEGGHVYPRFRSRIIIPIHDPRGRVVGFGGRAFGAETGGGTAPGGKAIAKYVNSPASEVFDKGELLFNWHRAAPLVAAAGRLVVVEGYMDVIACTRAGIGEAMAPMGTALTPGQLARLWRLHHKPILMFDGDGAGRKAALRACETALTGGAGAASCVGLGRELAIALLPDGLDPDDLEARGGRAALEAVLLEAVPLHDFVFGAVVADQCAGVPVEDCAPEVVAGIWTRLAALAGAISDDQLRAEYMGTWRARFERECSTLARLGEADAGRALQPLHAVHWDEATGSYAFPDSETDSERRFIQIVRAKLALLEERRMLRERMGDLDALAKGVGFNVKAINAVVKDIEADPEKREEFEGDYALYRRVAGVKGARTEAMMPALIEARAPRGGGAAGKRVRYIDALAGGV